MIDVDGPPCPCGGARLPRDCWSRARSLGGSRPIDWPHAGHSALLAARAVERRAARRRPAGRRRCRAKPAQCCAGPSRGGVRCRAAHDRVGGRRPGPHPAGRRDARVASARSVGVASGLARRADAPWSSHRAGSGAADDEDASPARRGRVRLSWLAVLISASRRSGRWRCGRQCDCRAGVRLRRSSTIATTTAVATAVTRARERPLHSAACTHRPIPPRIPLRRRRWLRRAATRSPAPPRPRRPAAGVRAVRNGSSGPTPAPSSRVR